MLRRTLNLGILAHVDAGKTTLTERLLYAAGVIDAVGDVDAGTTQTDTLALERQRGITIRSAVVSFEIAGVTVNLIDTPGHPDFIAEVERVLGLLDGAVLVISAVEGVQPQTRVLMRALRRLRVPTLLFVNKIDRRGADARRVLDAIAARLAAAIIPMGTVDGLGTRAGRFTPYGFDDPAFQTALTEALAERDDSLLAAYVENELAVTEGCLRSELAAQTRRSLVHPVFFGSAITAMINCGYSVADGPPSKRGPTSTPADFRNLTPMALMRALDQAGTVVCEPTLKVSLEIPVWAISTVLTALGRLGAAVKHQSVRGDLTTIETVVPAARVQDLQRQLPGLTAGEGVLESTFDGYRPLRGDPPVRPRTLADPRHREKYLISLTRQGARG